MTCLLRFEADKYPIMFFLISGLKQLHKLFTQSIFLIYQIYYLLRSMWLILLITLRAQNIFNQHLVLLFFQENLFFLFFQQHLVFLFFQQLLVFLFFEGNLQNYSL